MRRQDMDGAERTFAAMASGSLDKAYNDLLYLVQDTSMSIVSSWRGAAWALLDLTGKDHAHTLLRQSVRLLRGRGEEHPQTPGHDDLRSLLPRVLDEHRLLSRPVGMRQPDDAWIEQLSNTIYAANRSKAAETVAAGAGRRGLVRGHWRGDLSGGKPTGPARPGPGQNGHARETQGERPRRTRWGSTRKTPQTPGGTFRGSATAAMDWRA